MLDIEFSLTFKRAYYAMPGRVAISRALGSHLAPLEADNYTHFARMAHCRKAALSALAKRTRHAGGAL